MENGNNRTSLTSILHIRVITVKCRCHAISMTQNHILSLINQHIDFYLVFSDWKCSVFSVLSVKERDILNISSLQVLISTFSFELSLSSSSHFCNKSKIEIVDYWGKVR